MKKTILEIYALGVCFLMIITLAITLGSSIYNVIRISHPDFTLASYQYNNLISNESFCRHNSISATRSICTDKKDSEITQLRMNDYTNALQIEKRDAWKSLMTCGIVLIITTILFTLHWLIARRARRDHLA